MSRYLVSIPSTTELNFDGGVTLPSYDKAIDCMGMYHWPGSVGGADRDESHGRRLRARPSSSWPTSSTRLPPTLRKAAAPACQSGAPSPFTA